MENAVEFLFIPAPIWRGSQEGVIPPPTSTPKLTQLGRGGGRQVDLGGGGAEDSPGGAGGTPARERDRQCNRNNETQQTYCLIVTRDLYPREIYTVGHHVLFRSVPSVLFRSLKGTFCESSG